MLVQLLQRKAGWHIPISAELLAVKLQRCLHEQQCIYSLHVRLCNNLNGLLQVISAACAAFCSLATTCSEAADKLLSTAVYYHEALRRFLDTGSFRDGQPTLPTEAATVYIIRYAARCPRPLTAFYLASSLPLTAWHMVYMWISQ